MKHDQPAPSELPPDGLPPDGLPPDGLPPDGLSPDGLSPDGLSPDGLSPDGLSPDGLSPDGLSPDGLSPDGLSPDGLPPGLRRALEQLHADRDAQDSSEERWARQRQSVLRQLAASSAPVPKNRWLVWVATATAALVLVLAWWLPAESSPRRGPVAMIDEIDHSLAGRLPEALAPAGLLTSEFESWQTTESSEPEKP